MESASPDDDGWWLAARIPFDVISELTENPRFGPTLKRQRTSILVWKLQTSQP